MNEFDWDEEYSLIVGSLEDLNDIIHKRNAEEEFATREDYRDRKVPLEDYKLKEAEVILLLETFPTEDTVTKSKLTEMFSVQANMKDDGGFKSLDPKIPLDKEFLLTKGTLPNVKEDLVTTPGLYIFNLLVLVGSFKDKVDYINYTLTSGAMGGLADMLNDLMLEGVITPDEYITFDTNKIWLGSVVNEFTMRAMTEDSIKMLPEVIAEKARLFADPIIKEIINNNDAPLYVEKVEKPLLALAKDILIKRDMFDLYAVGKPDFNNTYKNMYITIGPLKNLNTGKYQIITNCLEEGVDPSDYAAFGNNALEGSVARGLKTGEGGYLTKLLIFAFQHLVAGAPGSDCKTDRYLEFVLEKDIAKDFMYQYIVVGENLVCLTSTNIKQYIGKKIKLRTVLYCKSKILCNKCIGDMPYKLNAQHLGILATKATNALMYLEMKKFHDSTVKTYRANLEDYIYEEK